MKIDILLFAQCRETAGRPVLALETVEGARVDDLWGAIEAACPALLRFRPTSRIAVNREFACEATRILSGDEVALIPPVSGG